MSWIGDIWLWRDKRVKQLEEVNRGFVTVVKELTRRLNEEQLTTQRLREELRAIKHAKSVQALTKALKDKSGR